MYVCMYVGMYVCMYVCIYVCMYVCVCMCVCCVVLCVCVYFICIEDVQESGGLRAKLQDFSKESSKDIHELFGVALPVSCSSIFKSCFIFLDLKVLF